METKNYESIISEYKDIEFRAHVSLDDVLNKVTQEAGEIIEAKQDGDLEEMYKEAQDTLINVVSVGYELGAKLEFDRKYTTEIGFGKFIIDLGNWNTKIQAFRQRYSREKANIDIVSKVTNELISDILSFADPMKDPISMLEDNTKKFLSRTGKYYEKIDLKEYIADIPNFPKTGIDFKDISPLLQDREALRNMIFEMAESCRNADVIAGLDARGFLFGEAIANLLNKPFVMIRKAGKLPGETIKIKYGLEYGNDEIEVQKGAIKKGGKIALVDDLLATGGTIEAAAKLVEKTGATVNNISFAISLDEPELINMPARQQIEKYKINSVLKYN